MLILLTLIDFAHFLHYGVNALRPKQNGWHFGDIFKLIFLYAKKLYFDSNLTEILSQ